MKKYLRVMLGQKSLHAEECFAGDFIGVDYGLVEDLTGKLPEEWRAFNETYIPVYLASHPGKSRIAAGLACGCLWTVAKGLNLGEHCTLPGWHWSVPGRRDPWGLLVCAGRGASPPAPRTMVPSSDRAKRDE